MIANMWKLMNSKSYILIKNKFFSRQHLSSEKIKRTEKDVEEIRIPVPWGHIAGKWWGEKDLPPVLAFHGWQDNANTFDTLIPLLNIKSTLAIDLPGHGCSSHLPEGRPYDVGEYIISIHRVKKYFNWEKIALLTHSFGGMLGFAYTSMFPDTVKWIINIECARSLMSVHRNNLATTLSQGVDMFLKTEKQKKRSSPPAYKLSKLIEMSIYGSLGSIASPKAALVLLQRGAYLVDKERNADKIQKESQVKTGGDLQGFIDRKMKMTMSLPESERENVLKQISIHKENWKTSKENLKNFQLKETCDQYYSFRRDPSIKVLVNQSFGEENILEASKNIKCPFLSVRARNGFLFGESRNLYEKSLENLQANAPYFEHHEVDGTHHVHLNTPENLAPIINQFLEKLTSLDIKPSEHSTNNQLGKAE